jgi:Kef-type K+ transport system membrane component KefB
MTTLPHLALAAEVGASTLVSLFWIMVAAVLAPVISDAVRRLVPEVVLLLGLGVVIGPFGLALASTDDGIGLISQLGLGFLFLLAGFEIDVATLTGPRGRRASLLWIGSLAVAVALGWFLVGSEDSPFGVAVVLGLAVTSTAVGTLLPIIKANGELDSPLGRGVLTHGAVGELGPVLAMSLLLSMRSLAASVAVLALFGVAALVVAVVPARTIRRIPGLDRAVSEGTRSAHPTIIRAVVLLLAALMATAAVLDLDVVLGAFAAGIILRGATDSVAARTASRAEDPEVVHALEERLESVAYAIFIPAFFVVSGMAIDTEVLAERPVALLAIVLIILLARGVPVWLLERSRHAVAELDTERDRRRLGLYAATGLPIIVAVTEVALRTELITETTSSVLVAAGAITVLVFPFVAGRMAAPRPAAVAADHPPEPGA